MTPDEAHRLEILITEGFGAVRGDINLLARGHQETDKDVEKLDARVRDLESRTFPLPVIGGLCGVAAVVLTVVQVIGKG